MTENPWYSRFNLMFMVRFILVIFLSCLSAVVSAQGEAIQKSTDIIVLRGKSYYLHTVQPGQTLFSICKAYGVGVDEVKALNDKKDNNLSLYEVLKIPFVETFVQQDGKYYYHKVAQGETIYSIARLYDIKPKRLLKYNESYSHNEPLSIGAVVRLPLNEIDFSKIKKKNEIIPDESALSSGDGIPVLEKQTDGEILIQSGQDSGAEGIVRDTLPISSYETLDRQGSKEMPDYISEVVMPADPYVKVAVLLPFSAQYYPRYLDSLGVYQSVNLSARSEQFISFYEGILLAVDSLKNLGYKIDLHVFDTERSSDKMYVIAGELNHLGPDLIIGPVYGSVYKMLENYLENKNIPVLYPLSSRTENFGEYPNFIQVNSTFEVLAGEMLCWLREQQALANIIHINLRGTEETDLEEKNKFREQLRTLEPIHFFNWNIDEVPLDSLRTLLLPDRENILILPVTKEADVSKILPLLSALTDGYQITVLGLPEWQTFTSVDHETYYKLNTKLFTYSYVDYASESARILADNYRKYFNTEPGTLVYKAFDLGMYFIELAARYRDRSLEALEYFDRTVGSSNFRFRKMKNGNGKENQGTFIVNYSSEYQLKIENWR